MKPAPSLMMPTTALPPGTSAAGMLRVPHNARVSPHAEKREGGGGGGTTTYTVGS
jgi:hypothetical protein